MIEGGEDAGKLISGWDLVGPVKQILNGEACTGTPKRDIEDRVLHGMLERKKKWSRRTREERK